MHHVKSEPRNQNQFYCLDQLVDPDSFVRIIDFFVDNIDLKSFGFTHVTLKSEGRPPIYPAQLLKLYIYGYRYGVRSSRKLEREAKLNIEARWLLGEVVSSNKTIANFRKDNAEQFRVIFRKFVFLLKELDLIEGKTIAIDSFKVRTQKTRKSKYEGLEGQLKATGKDTGEQIHQCEQHNITTYVSPKESASNNPDIFPITKFVYNSENDTYTCPAGETLATNGRWLKHSSKGSKSAYKFQRYNTTQ
ncbi:MAG: transposase [Paludibacter sp.]|nr:transposase [Paludibacter sp.]